MKKILLSVFAIFIISTSLTSCGNGKTTLPDPPKDLKYEGVTLIDGPLSGYVEVVPGSYLLELKKNETDFLLGYEGTMKVKLKFIKSIDVKSGSGYNRFGPSLLGKVLDEQGIPLDFELSADSDTDLATYLKRGSGEEWITLNMSAQGTCENAEDAKLQLETFIKGKKIRFNSEIVKEEFDSESPTTSTTDSISSEASSSSGDCDEFLADYEVFMVKYIDILKKYKNNPSDTSILSEYTSIMSEASQWSSKTADCANYPNFATKMAEIQMKISNAASGM